MFEDGEEIRIRILKSIGIEEYRFYQVSRKICISIFLSMISPLFRDRRKIVFEDGEEIRIRILKSIGIGEYRFLSFSKDLYIFVSDFFFLFVIFNN